MEENRKFAEEKELERRKNFVTNWKELKERKQKAETMQQGWKKLMESVASWEEDFEENFTPDYSEKDLQNWFEQEWTSEGVMEAGKIMDEIISEVLA